ncbi:ChaN family lipoprotein [Sulfitobacter pseudonitzschiae]|uniref:ChaN family lipoprotein n=2 Tax=Pseudosulfitobacter pseudonitzschiae TaxID=1402135 RepID=A0A9Q2P372_9RHOB|nr:ChaN family lipoprotein [Pseudosulfitobacter pseudonitzschiae]MBM2293667.1 ChaN family lipoprotein [Pseudosulfitobacter pseudonitzschiae]MBM2298481.1 ChaN family lipoprotein [Pseudosulfitobacter pseudonitzschiae]MBM2303395.1 ChaN family lipoprotein [Pseudosulfitobacter pseudonitzschiae]MBM2313178.1 ChaN family lipoprotein [Pseudosulfitobacter pseudonitzschiae]MBM2318091.1 ChaN family lipoprotein [Pseudosulfitobacter pseudonitzschiae]
MIPALLSWAVLSGAAFAFEPADVPPADIVIVGEVHDNPAHHTAQAVVVAQVQPKAIVWEMLQPAQAGLVTPELIENADAMAERLGWAEAGWPDFSMYHPIFAAAPDAISYGAAVPRELAQAVMQEPLGAAFDAAAAYGLDRDLSDANQIAREDLQRVAHCDALPKELLPAMVKVQRLRDATLAQAAVKALADTGGPVVVITGNGHARKDWGVPSYLAQVAPKARVWSIGQAEDGNVPDGGFDVVWDAPAQDRPDPCAALR